MMKKNNRPIGIFDSGIGGLTVAKEVIKELPHEDIVYFGDTARLPYGNKSPRTVIKFSVENTKFLLKFGVKLVIVACNTSSSIAIPTLRRRFRVPILGVIKPAVKKAVQITDVGRIGIIGTRTTIESKAYQREIKRLDPYLKSFAQACPLFVPLAEEGWVDEEVTLKVAKMYLAPLLEKNIDALVLGCTHYPILTKVIRKAMGKSIKFIDSAERTAQDAKRILVANSLCAQRKSRKGKCRFYVSDEPAVFKKVGKWFLGRTVSARVQKV
ncbi:MAG: glutamate racemase [Candidatus Omnitrophica bacterium]|nr:glutamate racemase [Candidatus Omnitrophota bacterium]